MESFRLFPHRDSEVCRKFVCQVRKVHRPFQRTLAEKAGYFYPVVVISFLAAALLTREENLLRISLLAVGITLQTLPFVLIGVLLSTGMQLYSSRPPWEIYLRKHPVLSVPLALIGGFFFPFCDCALTPLFRASAKGACLLRLP